MFACVFSLMTLTFANRFGYQEIIYGLYLTPGFILGYLLSGKLAAYIDRGHSRTVILIISSVSAVALIVKHLI